ncbi:MULTISPECIES: hypothetical protein [Clostridium]|uniref:Uncharacterized protein n=1 Tax=Clostridium carnis TaxID=1530 RepID=A0ABY6SRF4_9CLOT|nr:hypothetical protein [Clostridium carnis]CAI3560450.1 conserved hypothetical protein [Clostridium neonatale]CAI3561813.1 conserved hypothetical protein [Clostridium neonatale]CAI3582722.1 conserved hypothetical protein [Clostridium neonatale]CAI3622498.1 conserved hypothetical protein [Clostridium neonatale]CAI3675566.1 conserved hypothetical protein [Clostridium neonatale]
MLSHDEYTPKNIFSGNTIEVLTMPVVLAAGESVQELAPIYYDSTNKKYITKAPTDGTIDINTIYGLSCVNLEKTTEDTEIVAYVTGEFKKEAIVLTDGENIEDYIIPLRKIGIFIK